MFQNLLPGRRALDRSLEAIELTPGITIYPIPVKNGVSNREDEAPAKRGLFRLQITDHNSMLNLCESLT